MDKIQQLVYKGALVDVNKINFLQNTSQQKFVRDDVLISQSIDPYRQIEKANKNMLSGKSIFFGEHVLIPINK